MKVIVNLERDADLEAIRYLHDHVGGPRCAYAWAIGRVPEELGPRGPKFVTADLDTEEVEDFIFAFYTAYNKRYGLTY